MSDIKIARLTEEQAEKIRNSEKNRKDRAREADAYDNFTEQGKPYFFKCIDEIEDEVAREIIRGNLYINTTILSRIKDQESALNNEDIESMSRYALMRIILDGIDENDYTITEINNPYKEKEKSLDDVFGISIIVDTEREKQIIQSILKQIFQTKYEKPMTKDSYRAIHMQVYKKSEGNSAEWPLIECQIKTIKEDRESKEHTIYKVESAIERILRKQHKIKNPDNEVKIELTQSAIQKVYDTIQQYYNDGGFSPASNIPNMW